MAWKESSKTAPFEKREGMRHPKSLQVCLPPAIWPNDFVSQIASLKSRLSTRKKYVPPLMRHVPELKVKGPSNEKNDDRLARGMLGLLAAASTCFAQQYAVTDLGTLGGIYSVAYHLNNRGDAVGYSQITGSAVYDAFLYSNGIMTDLGTLGGSGSQALGINNTGQVVGLSYTTGNNPFNGAGIGHAFIYSGGVMTDLGTLGGTLTSSAYAINDAGQVVGSAETTGNTAVHAFLYSGGVMTDLGALDLGSGSYNDSVATAINTGGQAAGYSFNGFLTHAFLYSGGIMTDLGTLGGQTGFAFGINNRGDVVGFSQTTGNAFNHAFLYSGGVMTDLGTLGGTYSEGFGINDLGEVVGGHTPQATRLFMPSSTVAE